MHLREPYRLLVIVAITVVVWLGWNPDTRFESSDAQWWDSTVNLKGRHFDTIMSGFDMYRAKCRRPDVHLLRTTPMHVWNIGAWAFYLVKEQWRVPFNSPTMCSVGSRCPLGGAIECGESANYRLERPVTRSSNAP
jgi:hypothetical protein